MIPVRATGLLRDFAEAGVLEAADVHVALRLSQLGGEGAETVLLAAALAVRGVRTGSVCVDLATIAGSVLVDPDPDHPDPDDPDRDDPGAEPTPDPTGAVAPPLAWPETWDALQDSPLVAVGVDAPWRPLRLVHGLLYLDRYWQQEQLVRRELDQRAARPTPALDLSALPGLFPVPGPDRQRLAVAVAADRWVSVITGGPGTGKTHTVARLLALLLAQPGPTPRIALTAPTGKAAARLQESVQSQAAAVGLPLDLTASTLHRLLGWRPDSQSRFRHHAGNRLPYDVVVVDESSMVSLTLMARLLDAVRPTARLVLVGDPDQLTPVDAGAVLSDLVHRPAPTGAPVTAPSGIDPTELDLDGTERAQLGNGIVRLRVSHRYGHQIGALAEAIRTGDADATLGLLHDGGSLTLEPGFDALRTEVTATGVDMAAAASAGDAARAITLLGTHRLLCAHRTGPHGVTWWNEECSRWSGATGARWYAGQPLLITANDYENALHNGDTGVVVETPDGLQAAFARAGGIERIALSRLSSVVTAHALTVHRSQGSQYESVTLVLPPPTSPLLTRELFYTAITRASAHVRVIGSEESVRAAVGRQLVRASGLRRTSTG
ncbi:exodeoxyribonuclease V subunit alpha [Rhodococcus antarcticus]|uniref:RecBCD enzyme subunit RecD n=1 Tax=Rhodococcus antarcticus TaxID=2987751 RepID=A0ABY6P3J6_9NOCA|nr:exodeoxyribonuclease V subunit alpha [Rhodococcus antarcticus]UZJ26221.1 exodeoxyribonuclease V subunit alpha [Rhodococcus antarcticus]